MEEPAVRDGEFYIEMADCVIRVDNTLFKVHQYLLGRDSSAFQNMFNMPAHPHTLSKSVEGCSDENPIRLYGESPERFRALLSVIYKLPQELHIYNTSAADVEQLLTIAEVTNKYHFTSTEQWAVDALHDVLSGMHGPSQTQYDLGRCSSLCMKRLLEVALLCGHTKLLNYVADRWADRIVTVDLRPIHALEIADRSGIRRLQGYAYYVQLLEMNDAFEPGVIEDGKEYSRWATAASARTGTPASLTHAQRQRLLFGHWSLSRLWDRLRSNAPEFQQSVACTNHQGCVSTWKQVWRELGNSEATLTHSTTDVLGRLRVMDQELFADADLFLDLRRGMMEQCRRSAVEAFRTGIKEMQQGLADHFASAAHIPEE